MAAGSAPGRSARRPRFTRQVSQAVGRPLTASQARHLVALRDAADAARDRLPSRTGQFGDTFGGLYAGERTDMAAVRSALDWARRLRATITGTDAPLTPAQARRPDGAIPAANPRTAADAWKLAPGRAAGGLPTDRRQDLGAELDDYDEAADLIAALRQDTGGQG